MGGGGVTLLVFGVVVNGRGRKARFMKLIHVLHPRSIATAGQIFTSLQPHHRPQANGISPEAKGTCEGPASNAEADKRRV